MAYIECIVDTHVLADIIAQYDFKYPNKLLEESKFLSGERLKLLNKIIDSNGFDGRIIASTFAFVEIMNKFDEISKGKFDRSDFRHFTQCYPNWFLIEPLDIKTSRYFVEIPKYLEKNEKLELADALHVATALQRGSNPYKPYLATGDSIIRLLNLETIEII